jgi:hypothetical protein
MLFTGRWSVALESGMRLTPYPWRDTRTVDTPKASFRGACLPFEIAQRAVLCVRRIKPSDTLVHKLSAHIHFADPNSRHHSAMSIDFAWDHSESLTAYEVDERQLGFPRISLPVLRRIDIRQADVNLLALDARP